MLKKLLLVAVALFLVGGLTFFVAFAASGFNKNGIAATEIKENLYEEKIDNALTSISIDYANANIIVSVGEKLTVTYPEHYTKGGNPISRVTLNDNGGKLVIDEEIDSLKSVGYDLARPTVKITVPSGRALTLDLETELGDVTLSGINAEKLHASAENGFIALNDITSNGIIDLETERGEIEMFGTITATGLEAETGSGDISHKDGIITADKISFSSDVGDVLATLAGKESDYTVLIEKDLGSSNISNSTSGPRRLEIELDFGSVEIYFEK
ncbi:MAG: DUF4097 family beta strand repeat protein [Clostridia bacterium]|nr:DUF4097 family beta strand repeat protein [Clostridia bacterium]